MKCFLSIFAPLLPVNNMTLRDDLLTFGCGYYEPAVVIGPDFDEAAVANF